MHLERSIISDLIETFEIMMLTKRYFCKLDDSNRRQDQNLFKNRFILDVRKFTFINGVVNVLIAVQ